MPIKLPSFSRLKETQAIITESDGDRVETFGLWKEPSFLTQKLDPQLEVIHIRVDSRRAGRPDLIANDVYGSPSYFWVLLAYNKPQEIFGWPKNGTVVLAPTAQIVLSSL